MKLTDEGVAPNKRGIVLLGDALEADSELSLNKSFYGSLHNQGHIIISAAHDPDNAHKVHEYCFLYWKKKNLNGDIV